MNGIGLGMTPALLPAYAGADALAEAILALNPIAFWPCNELSGATAVCQVDSPDQDGSYANVTLDDTEGPIAEEGHVNEGQGEEEGGRQDTCRGNVYQDDEEDEDTVGREGRESRSKTQAPDGWRKNTHSKTHLGPGTPTPSQTRFSMMGACGIRANRCPEPAHHFPRRKA